MFAAGYWQIVETVVTVPAAPATVQLVPADSQRWAWSVLSGNAAIVASTTTPAGTLGALRGLEVAGNVPFLMRYADWGGAAQSAWAATSPNGLTTVTVMQIRLLSTPPQDS